jgi:RNA polymerase sigma-70 factor (ECF subfamily)
MITAPPATQSDPPHALIRQAQDGDDEALKELLEPYRRTLFHLAFRIVADAEEAEDLCQDIFLRILLRLPTFRGECRFYTWVYRIALNVCLTARARRRPGCDDLETAILSDPAPGPEASAFQREFHRRVSQELRRMPAIYREVVLLRLTEELTTTEIAETLNISLDTARMRVYRGMERLRQRLKPWQEER